jgi:hypothetical protein
MGIIKYIANRKRGTVAGLCAGAVLAITLIALSTTVYAGCAGDCMTCHPKLKGSEDHRSLTTCINCHDPVDKKKLFTLGESSEGCGDNCFECHDNWPKDGYHADLISCIDCHENFVLKK